MSRKLSLFKFVNTLEHVVNTIKITVWKIQMNKIRQLENLGLV